jgi:hypothetical protein
MVLDTSEFGKIGEVTRNARAPSHGEAVNIHEAVFTQPYEPTIERFGKLCVFI